MKKYLLDSSFVIDLLNEMADNDEEGPALQWLKRNRRARLWISPVTLAEVLEGAQDPKPLKPIWGGTDGRVSIAYRRRRRRRDKSAPQTAWVRMMPGRPPLPNACALGC